MLADDVYDAFFLVPLYMAMYYGADLHIRGAVSKKLYKNAVTYLQRILCDFSDDLKQVNVYADGFRRADGRQTLIGAGLSCGVDSLSTVYDHYVKESDPDYRINALFFFDTGWHGDFYDAGSWELCLERYRQCGEAAGEMGLPLYLVRTNFHAFTYGIYKHNRPGSHMGYFANYSCLMALQKVLKKYYVSNCFSYSQILNYGKYLHDSDFCEFSESYSVPLIQTESLEVVIDGCQYERSGKIERLSNWDIARKYLNVCIRISSSDGRAHNCSECVKCMLTLMTLDVLGKLDNFSKVFDLEAYRKNLPRWKNEIAQKHMNGKYYSNEPNPYDFLKSHGMKFPSPAEVRMSLMMSKISSLSKKALRKIIGGKLYGRLKNLVKGQHA